MSYRYTAYTLNLESDWALPALVSTDGMPDVTIREVSPTDFPKAVQQQPGWYLADPNHIFLNASGVGLCGIEGGQRIFAAADPTLSSATWGVFLISTALNLLLFQRDFLLLHASVIVIDGKAAGFLGASGWGKSTLAAAFEARGHSIIGDDTLAIDLHNPGFPLALPAYPQMKLYPDALMMVGVAPEPLPRVSNSRRSGDEKRLFAIADHFMLEPTPLRYLFVLDKDDFANVERLNAGESFRELLIHSFVGKTAAQFGVNLLAVPARAQRHLEQCTNLVTSVPIHRLRRRWSLDAIDEAVSLIENTIAQSR
jgi:hypothetical protein